uniref:protein SCAR2-like n=1 Tax=Erigeron canadensis TaxID=72917 RepID=UPI001CB98663|nr:protein SCAR2-like [Erigeron canadensis]
MPFSRYQIRNEFSLADPELYKSADKDDPEALLEAVAMAGLVGVLRQLGDLAEFAAEIFHGLHEEVMVTAARGHGLLVRVQQVESDFPAIERAFLSQTGHSAFFSSSGISWHPHQQMEQNLITKGDLPRFVMDSYEECRGPPRLFLLDKFDVAGAGACLKRYTDPSFYKVETSPYEMMNGEAQRDKKARKAKKKGPRWKHGEMPEVFQPSSVKLHQLLLEERVQNGASEPARRVKLKKREIKFPFDTETGKGYMEQLLNSPPEDKLVHEVSVSYSPPRLATNSYNESGPEPLEVRGVHSPLVSPYESPIVDKAVSREHLENAMEDVPEMQVLDLSTSSIKLQSGGDSFGIEEADVEEKQVSVYAEHKDDSIEDAYQSDDVASETDNYMDALATMESEVETDAELKANSGPTKIQLQSQSSESQSASDDENSPIKKKLTSFSYSDAASSSAESMSPHGVDSSQAFGSTEIPFRPRVPPSQASDNCLEMSDMTSQKSAADGALSVDQGSIFRGGTSKESDLSETSASSCVGLDRDQKIGEIDIDPEDIIASSSFVGNPQIEEDIEDDIDNSSSIASFRGGIQTDEEIIDDVHESKSDPADADMSYSSDDEREFKDRETISVFSESKAENAAVCDPVDDCNGDDNLHTLEEEKELEEEPESVNSETEDLIPVTIQDDVNIHESKVLSTCDDIELDNNEDNDLSTTEEHAENGLVIDESAIAQNSLESAEKMPSEQPIVSPELDSMPSDSYNNPEIQFLERVDNTGIAYDVDNPCEDMESSESVEQKESSEQSVVPIPYASYNHSDIQDLDTTPKSSIYLNGDVNENDVDNQSTKLELLQDETLFVMENVDQNVPNSESNAKLIDNAPDSPVSSDARESNSLDQDVESESAKFVDQVVESKSLDEDVESKSSKFADQDVRTKSLDHDDQIDEHEAASSICNHSVSTEEKAGQPEMQSIQLEKIDSQNHIDRETYIDNHPDSDPVGHESYCLDQGDEFQRSFMADLSQLSGHVNQSGFNMLPQLAPINIEEMPPLPPLPPMQWRMGKPQNCSLTLSSDGGLNSIHHIPPSFPQIESHLPVDQNENATNDKSEHDNKVFNSVEDGNLIVSSEVNVVKLEEVIPQPASAREQFGKVSTSGRDIIRPSSTSSLPPLPPGDDKMPNGIRPMKVQRPRTPLIDAVAAHDKSKLRKVSERAMPPVPKEEERDTLLEQIRMKSFNLKPAVQTRPSIQGPSTNLRVAAILEKANAIRQAFAGSDDDEDDNDSWSDS